MLWLLKPRNDLITKRAYYIHGDRVLQTVSRSHGLFFPFMLFGLTIGRLPVQNLKKEPEIFIDLNAKLVKVRKPNL